MNLYAYFVNSLAQIIIHQKNGGFFFCKTILLKDLKVTVASFSYCDMFFSIKMQTCGLYDATFSSAT